MRLLLFILLLCFSSFLAVCQSTTTVYFHFDQHNLTDSAKKVLDELAARTNIQSMVIHGHCDQLGSNAYNIKLSLKRANAVKEYLIAKGLDEARIVEVKAFGEDQPVIDQLDEVSRQANRRVTILTTDQETATTAQTAPVTVPAERPQKTKLEETIKDTATKTGQNIILRNINFYGGQHVFLPQSYPALQELLHTMQNIPTLEIEIQGHICCYFGNGDGLDIDTGERALSLNRAKAVYQFLIENGIDANRMKYVGFGRRFPIVPFERTEEDATTNRRVEIKILKK